MSPWSAIAAHVFVSASLDRVGWTPDALRLGLDAVPSPATPPSLVGGRTERSSPTELVKVGYF